MFNISNLETFVAMYLFLSIDGFYRQVKQISGAHNKAETTPSTKIKRKRSSARGMAPSVVSFLNKPTLLFPPPLLVEVLLHRREAGFLKYNSRLLQDTQQSVTVVLFQDQHTLISSGAVDG